MSQCLCDYKNSQWIPEDLCCELLNIKQKTLRNNCSYGKYNHRVSKKNGKSVYFIHINSLPEYIQKKINTKKKDDNSGTYSNVPEWSKAQAYKYINIIKDTINLKGKKLEEFIKEWNNKHPENKTSYPSIIRMRRRYNVSGISGLLSQRGNINRSLVEDKYFNYFKNLYLTENAPSLRSCWDSTIGYAIRTDNINKDNFPSHTSFLRRLKKEVPTKSIYLARNGHTAWNRKYGAYIDRDYSCIKCGKVWVSDHAQIDIACMTTDGNVVFPWVTAWRDFKSGKWLGWILQSGSPNSDRIFQSFYYAAERYGLPEDVIIDNGKDYRSKDFAGGRNVIKVSINKTKTTSMLDELNVDVHFALPYNAQTKPIERDFLKIKELMSKHSIGYRGGNVVERPEKLIKEIKNGKIMQFNDFKKIFDDFIVNILNKRPSDGKNLNGFCPDELFNSEFTEKITTSHEALKLFCTRISKNFTIGRNGISDKSLGITYWADWMIVNTGLKVYLRRDPENYKEAWVFRADNEEFIGMATVTKAVAALHADTITKEEFKEALAIKKRNLKVTESYIKHNQEISLEEQCENYKAAYAKIIKKATPRVSKIANTNMDSAVRKRKEMAEVKNISLAQFIEEKPSTIDDTFYYFETDRILDEELKGVANGY